MYKKERPKLSVTALLYGTQSPNGNGWMQGQPSPGKATIDAHAEANEQVQCNSAPYCAVAAATRNAAKSRRFEAF